MKLFSRQYKILYILETTILILYRKLYINIVSSIVLNIATRQYNIKINLAISCSPSNLSIFSRGPYRVTLPCPINVLLELIETRVSSFIISVQLPGNCFLIILEGSPPPPLRAKCLFGGKLWKFHSYTRARQIGVFAPRVDWTFEYAIARGRKSECLFCNNRKSEQ